MNLWYIPSHHSLSDTVSAPLCLFYADCCLADFSPGMMQHAQYWCTLHHAKNKPLFTGTLLCACMCIDNMDVGHRVLLALIAEQELQHSGLDSTHGWKIEPRDKTWSFVAFCASAVCTRSGTGVKQTQLPQQNEVTHQQVWRWQWVKTYPGGKKLEFWESNG